MIIEAVLAMITLLPWINRAVATQAKCTALCASLTHGTGATGTGIGDPRITVFSNQGAYSHACECEEAISRTFIRFELAQGITAIVARTVAIIALLACYLLYLSISATIRRREFAPIAPRSCMVAFLPFLEKTITTTRWLCALRSTQGLKSPRIDLVLNNARIVAAITILLALVRLRTYTKS